jgi:uncharacterized DUF497 family protein
MKLHRRFEWDKAKAAENSRRHGVTFEQALKILGQEDGDLYLFEDYDDEHSDEEARYCTFGSHPDGLGVVVRISWTDRTDEYGQITRIISARRSNGKERKAYEEYIWRRNRS